MLFAINGDRVAGCQWRQGESFTSKPRAERRGPRPTIRLLWPQRNAGLQYALHRSGPLGNRRCLGLVDRSTTTRRVLQVLAESTPLSRGMPTGW